MTIIKQEPQENGAYANQTVAGRLKSIPEGWLEVPEELTAAAREVLPWAVLKIVDGRITQITENSPARAAFEAAQAESLDSGEVQ